MSFLAAFLKNSIITLLLAYGLFFNLSFAEMQEVEEIIVWPDTNSEFKIDMPPEPEKRKSEYEEARARGEVYCQDGCDAMIKQAEEYGPMTLIVGINVPALDNPDLKTNFKQSKEEQQKINEKRKTLIKEVKDRVFDRVKPKKLRYIWEDSASFTLTADAETIKRLVADPEVTRITKNSYSRLSLSQSGPLVGVETAWREGFSGNGYTIAILDTGVDKTHPFLAGKVVAEACFSSSDEGSDPIYGDWTISTLCPDMKARVENNPSPGQPCTSLAGCEHGTHVAGIAAGKGEDFSGIAKQADIIAIQIFARGEGDFICGHGPSPCLVSSRADQITALKAINNYYTNYHQIAAVNLSLSEGIFFDEPCDNDSSFQDYVDTVKALKEKNIPTIIASGNDGKINQVSSPACIKDAISVGSTTKTDAVSYFSNNSRYLDILAPGGSGAGGSADIYSAVPGGGFAYMPGTSMAAPHVAGAHAVLREKFPNYSAIQIQSLLQGNGVPIKDTRPGAADNLTKYRMKFSEMPISAVINDKTNLVNMEMDNQNHIYVAYEDVLMKYTVSNKILWEKRFDEPIDSMILDNQGNVYLGAENTIYKFSPTGTLLWTNFVGKIHGMAVDNNNSVYVLMDLLDMYLDFYMGVIKFNSAGDEMWNERITARYGSYYNPLASRNLIKVDASGNVYTTMTKPCTGNCQADAESTLVVKISAAGDYQWGTTVSVPDSSGRYDSISNVPTSAALDSAGNFYIAGYACANYRASGTSINCQDKLVSYELGNTSDAYSLMLLKFSPSGAMTWGFTTKLGAQGMLGQKMVMDTHGAMYVGGVTCVLIDETGCIDNSYLLVKYDANGAGQWLDTYIGSQHNRSDSIMDIVYDVKNRQVHATGFTCEDTESLSANCNAFAARTLSYSADNGQVLTSKALPVEDTAPLLFSEGFMSSLIAVNAQGQIAVTAAKTGQANVPLRKYSTLFYPY